MQAYAKSMDLNYGTFRHCTKHIHSHKISNLDCLI